SVVRMVGGAKGSWGGSGEQGRKQADEDEQGDGDEVASGERRHAGWRQEKDVPAEASDRDGDQSRPPTRPPGGEQNGQREQDEGGQLDVEPDCPLDEEGSQGDRRRAQVIRGPAAEA